MVHSEVYEGLLPQPPSASPQARHEDRGWGSSLKTCALCVSLLFNLAFWYSSAPQQVALAPPAPAAAESSWLSAAVQAAETAAMRSCSGHGDVFIDTVLVGNDGAQICECHECFTGPHCAVPIPDCAADADRLPSSPPSGCPPTVLDFLWFHKSRPSLRIYHMNALSLFLFFPKFSDKFILSSCHFLWLAMLKEVQLFCKSKMQGTALVSAVQSRLCDDI